MKLETVSVPSFPAPAPARGVTCLVLDEDVLVYEAVKEILGETHQVLWRTTMASALAVMASQTIAVLVTELQVGDGDTSVMLKTLKQEYPDVLTIINTSFKDTVRVSQLINQAQVFRYLPKPLRKGLLAKSLESTLMRYKQLQDVPVLKEATKVEVSSDVQEKAISTKIMDYLSRLRAKGFGAGVGAEGLSQRCRKRVRLRGLSRRGLAGATLRADLTCEWACRLLAALDNPATPIAVPIENSTWSRCGL